MHAVAIAHPANLPGWCASDLPAARKGRGLFCVRAGRSLMQDKCVRQLPPLRVSEPLELALLRLAAMEERHLSEYVRLVLERHCFGHALEVEADAVDQGAAVHRFAMRKEPGVP